MQHQQQDQQRIEDIVRREHGNKSRRLHGRAVDDPGKQAQSSDAPHHHKEGENGVAHLLVLRVLGELCSL